MKKCYLSAEEIHDRFVEVTKVDYGIDNMNQAFAFVVDRGDGYRYNTPDRAFHYALKLYGDGWWLFQWGYSDITIYGNIQHQNPTAAIELGYLHREDVKWLQGKGLW